MLSTAHFEDLCTECSFAKSRYIVRFYKDTIDNTLTAQELPQWHCTFVLVVDNGHAHAEAASGKLTTQNKIDFRAWLKEQKIKTCRWERVSKGYIKTVVGNV
jgi:hypothetical protein